MMVLLTARREAVVTVTWCSMVLDHLPCKRQLPAHCCNYRKPRAASEAWHTWGQEVCVCVWVSDRRCLWAGLGFYEHDCNWDLSNVWVWTLSAQQAIVYCSSKLPQWLTRNTCCSVSQCVVKHSSRAELSGFWQLGCGFLTDLFSLWIWHVSLIIVLQTQ